MRYLLALGLLFCSPPTLAYEVDPAYSAAAEATGGKVYKMEPGDLNDPVKRETLVQDMLKDLGAKPGFGTVDFHRFELVRKNADIHGGYFLIETQPPAGTIVIGLATLFGEVGTVSFHLIDENNNRLQDISLAHDNARVADNQYIGHFTMPAVSFRAMATGVDADGRTFERYASELITPASLNPVP